MIYLRQNDLSNLCFYRFQNAPSLNQLKKVEVYIEPSSLKVEIQPSVSNNAHQIKVIRNEALQVFSAGSSSQKYDDTYLYLKFPETYSGNQLKSYGGYINYTIRYEGTGDPITFTPDIILIVSVI